MSDNNADELIHTAESPIYHRLADESHSDYELFSEWCKITPSARTMANFSRRTSIQPKLARKLIEKWRWQVRAEAFDHDSLQLRPDPRSMDEEASIAGQLAASAVLLDMGLTALALKNPALIPVDKAIKLAEKGVEIQRRAMGQADLNVQFNVEDMTRVNKLIGELIGEDDIEDAEIIDNPDVPEIEDPGEDPDLPM
jgi:hypothetical protein